MTSSDPPAPQPPAPQPPTTPPAAPASAGASRTGARAFIFGCTWKGFALRGACAGLVLAISALLLAPYALALWIEHLGVEVGLALRVPAPTVERGRVVFIDVSGERIEAEDPDNEAICDSVRIERIEVKSDLWSLAFGGVDQVEEITIDGLAVWLGPGSDGSITARVRRLVDRFGPASGSKDDAPKPPGEGPGAPLPIKEVRVRGARLTLTGGLSAGLPPLTVAWDANVAASGGAIPHVAVTATSTALFAGFTFELHPTGAGRLDKPAASGAAADGAARRSRLTWRADVRGIDLRALGGLVGEAAAKTMSSGRFEAGGVIELPAPIRAITEGSADAAADVIDADAFAWESGPIRLSDRNQPLITIARAEGTLARVAPGVTVVRLDLDGITTDGRSPFLRETLPLHTEDGTLRATARVTTQPSETAGRGGVNRWSVRVSDLAFADRGVEQLSVRAARATFDLATGALTIRSADLDTPALRIERGPTGMVRVGGFTVFDPEAPLRAPTTPSDLVLSIARARIRNGRLLLRDVEYLDQPLVIEQLDALLLGLDTKASGPTSTLDLTASVDPIVGRLGLHAAFRLDPLDVLLSGGLYGVDLRREPMASLLKRAADLRFARGALSLGLRGTVRGGKVALTPQVVGQRIALRGRGLGRGVPGTGGSTVKDVFEQLADDEGNLDIQIPIEFDWGQYTARGQRIVEREGQLREAQARHAFSVDASGAAPLDVEVAAIQRDQASRIAALSSEIRSLRSEQTSTLGGIDAGAIVGEALRQAVGGAVSGLIGLFQRPKTLRRLVLPFDPGSAQVPDASLSGLRYLSGALSDAPTACVVVRGSADPEADAVAGDAALRLAEDRALAVRAALVKAGANAERVLVARPFDADSAFAAPLGSVVVLPVR